MTVVGPFSEKVSDFVVKAKTRPTRVYREATKSLVRVASRTKAQGGNMPVKTGYLRQSLVVGLNARPRIDAVNPKKQAKYVAHFSDIYGLIDTIRLGKDKVYIVWTARYARVAELENGFARLAAQQWRSIVDRVAKQIAKD